MLTFIGASTTGGTLRGVGNGRLANQGMVDLGTFAGEGVFKYLGFSLQAEYFFRNQDRHTHTVTGLSLTSAGSVGNATGWYAQSGYYVIPKKLEFQARYGWFDPDTRSSRTLSRKLRGASIGSLTDTTRKFPSSTRTSHQEPAHFRRAGGATS